MSNAMHVAVNNETVVALLLMDVATADLFREYEFVEMMWGSGAILIDVTNADPLPAVGWAWSEESGFSAPIEEALPEPEAPIEDEPVTN